MFSVFYCNRSLGLGFFFSLSLGKKNSQEHHPQLVFFFATCQNVTNWMFRCIKGIVYVNYDHFHAEFCVALNESQVVRLLRYHNDAENCNVLVFNKVDFNLKK